LLVTGCWLLVSVCWLLVAGFQAGTLVYPNPNPGSISISLNKVYAQLDVKMINTTGQLVYSEAFKHSKNIHFEIENKAGIYFIELQADKDQKAYYKILIE